MEMLLIMIPIAKRIMDFINIAIAMSRKEKPNIMPLKLIIILSMENFDLSMQ